MLDIINSRHRDFGKLVMTKVNADSLVGQASTWDTHTLIGSTNFYMECKITIRAAQPTVNSLGIMGNSRFPFRVNAFFCWVDNADRLQFHTGTSGFIPIFSFEATYVGKTIILRIAYEVGRYNVYVNGVLKYQSPITVNTITNDVQDYATVNGYGTSAGDGTVAPNTQSDYTYHYVDFNGDKWKLEEPNGFNCVSSNGNIMIGQTANAGGLTYWDDEVRKR